ncbi:ATP adenylyltransferase [Emydomyces testavorans]|uniref:ATP adenylyltransferase n=1 Tax=Emydomyces testavorans TaxID=2070801 RepID=A0AAF0DAV1_9EURO|nr:ATP adenylyltransferase [Emydomyces testavorans]
MEDLESRALQQFDKLVQRGSIIFKDAPPVHIPARPFNVRERYDHAFLRTASLSAAVLPSGENGQELQFRIASSLTKKPQVEIKEAETQPRKPQDKPSPFANDPPDFVLEHVGPEHTLRFNKFCVVRPQFVLHTNEFKPQIEPLAATDLAAAWSVLCRLESPYIVIYNGGMQGGWSLPHRHMQLLPRPPRDVHDLFPDTYGIQNGVFLNIHPLLGKIFKWQTSTDSQIQHAVRMLPQSPTEEQIFSIYNDLLTAAGVSETDYSHNLVLVREWMLVIPRSRASQEGVKIVNAAGMVGMIWIPSNDVLDIWLQSSNPMDILARFGKPW